MEKRAYFWENNGVRLRLTNKKDYEMKYQEYCDTEARRNIQQYIELPKTIEEYKNIFENMDNDNVIYLCIENSVGEFVGWINLVFNDRRSGVCSINFGIFREYLRKGYAYEAARIVLQYAFEELRYQKCQADCFTTNEPSVNLLKKLGFVEEGRKRRAIFTNGEYYDLLVFGITKEEFTEIELRRG